MSETQKFDKHFEEKIIQSLLMDEKYAQQMMDVVELKYFDLSYTTKIAELLIDHYKNYETFPTISLLESILNREEKDDLLRRQCLAFLSNIKKKQDFNDLDYVKDKSLQFFKVKNFYRVLDDEVLPLLEQAETENGDFLERISGIVQKATVKGTDRDIGYDYLADESERFKEQNFTVVPTPWPVMNEILGGGWGNGRLIMGVGPAGSGKSFFGVQAGVGALLSKTKTGEAHTVLHITLELGAFEVAKRYDAALTGIPINDIVGSKEKILNHLKEKIMPGAKLIIKEWPMRSAGVSNIKTLLSQLKVQSIHPSIIIIDYGDLLRSGVNEKEKRHSLGDIWIEMKSLAQEYNIPVFTLTQANRSAYSEELVTAETISESFDKLMHCDFAFGIARNLNQKQIGIGKILVFKNRQGPDSQILAMRIDTNTASIKLEEMTPEIEEEIKQSYVEQEAKKQQSIADSLKKLLASKG